MRSLRRLAPVLVLVLAPVLVACGDGDDDNRPPSESTPDPPEMSSTATSDATAGSVSPPVAPAGLPAACEVLTADDLTEAYGVAFGTAQPGGGGHAEGDLEWQSDNCSWTAQDLVDVQIALTAPEDFTAGDFTCPEPTAIASTVEPVPGLGDRAYWEVDEAPPLEATLRVCTPSYNLDVDLDYEDGVDFEGDPKEQTIALARVVLGELG